MAEAQLARADAQGAAERLRGLLDLAPWHRELRYKLALALEEAGDTEEAAAQYRAFLTSWRDADPDAASLIDAKARLAALSSSS